MNGTVKIESRENPMIGHILEHAYGNFPLVDLPMMSDQRGKVKLKIQSVVEKIEDERELKIILSFIQGLKKPIDKRTGGAERGENLDQGAGPSFQEREGGHGVETGMV